MPRDYVKKVAIIFFLCFDPVGKQASMFMTHKCTKYVHKLFKKH